MPNKLDKVLDPEVAQDFFDEGYSVAQLATEFWVSIAIVYKFVDEHGLQPPPMRTLENTVDLDHVVQMLNDGAHFDDVADYYEFSKVAIKKYCGEHGIFQVFRFLPSGKKVRVREDARGEKVLLDEDRLEKIVELLQQAWNWDQIADELGYSRSFCHKFAKDNGIYSMYTRLQGKLFQIRSHPRDPQKFENLVRVDPEQTISA